MVEKCKCSKRIFALGIKSFMVEHVHERLLSEFRSPSVFTLGITVVLLWWA